MQIGNQPYPFSATSLEGGGRVVVGTTPVRVSFSKQVKSMIITADEDNTGRLYFGGSNVLSDGSNAMGYLKAGDHIEIDYDDTDSGIYIVATKSEQTFWKGGML